MIRLIPLIVALVFASGSALAAPGDLAWVRDGTSNEVGSVSAGVVSVTFGPGADDSKLLYVNADVADFCFLPDTLAGAGTARITLFRALTSPATDLARITLPAITFDGTDCDAIVKGSYWFEIDTAADTGDLALVTVTGR